MKLKAKKHLGLYVYKRDVLLTLAKLPQSELEKLEKLEQLRALENQIKIKMIKVKSAAIGIDTEADYLKALELISSFGIKPPPHKEF
jgi:3-deoxy-manno-octulosonate cytidylyltransferase (CMP-KDO synthetase)